MRCVLILLAGTVLSTQAWALDTCNISPSDKQVRVCVYNPLQRYQVVNVVGFTVNLVFSSDEEIKRIEFAYTGGDEKGNPTQTWTGPKKPDKSDKGDNDTATPKNRFHNNLPIWALFKGHSELVIVTTRPDGSERPYMFDLIARPAAADCDKTPDGAGCPGDSTTTAALNFTYPLDEAAAKAKAAADKKAAAVVVWQEQQKTVKEQTAVARLKQDVFYGGARNWKYQAKAEEKWKFMAPLHVSDNGWLTAFEWPKNVQVPTITIVDPVTGKPRTANYTQQGNLIIVPATAVRFRLFVGEEPVMDIINGGWSPNRPDPETGTTSPDVVRVVNYADGKPAAGKPQ